MPGCAEKRLGSSWGGVSRRTVLVTGIVASAVIVDAAQEPVRYLAGKMSPRFRKKKPELTQLNLNRGVYENQDQGTLAYGGTTIAHFVRADGTARWIYERPQIGSGGVPLNENRQRVWAVTATDGERLGRA